MKRMLWGLLAGCALLAFLGGCASQRADGRESSITAYGTVDIGISRGGDR